MKDGKYKFGVIASKISIVEGAKRILEEEGHELHIAYSSLDEAIPAGRKMEAAGVEAILSWRGTTNLLRENLHIPVLSFPQTSLDILSCLKSAAGLGKKILLPVFRSRLNGLDLLEELLGIELIQGIYHDKASLECLIYEAGREGCEVVIGGGTSLRNAKKYGLHGVEIQVSEDVIAATIENAKSVVKSNREEQEKAQRYHCIIDSASEGIIAVDQDNIITTVNRAARDYLRCDEQEMIGKPVTTFIPESPMSRILRTQSPLLNNVEKIDQDSFVFNHIPVVVGGNCVGGVSTFRDISNVMRAENKVRRTLTKGLEAKYHLGDLIYESKVMRDVITRVRRFAQTDSTILITGETGTGKEIIAHSIHNLSRRSRFPFVSINCAALPDQLLESELFGYEEGAFTGSKKGGKPGLFEMSHLGTVFLDEVATTPPGVQVRLLRVLQEREVMRLGADRVIPIDVRVLAAVNKDLEGEVQSGRFREDLFFRFNVLQIHLPPLRRRPEDIPALTQAFILEYSTRHNLAPQAIPADCLKKLCNYFWPGNIRQLKNFIERLVLLCNDQFEQAVFDELYGELIKYSPGVKPRPTEVTEPSLKDEMARQKKDSEAEIIHKALEQARFSKGKAAEILGISRTTLWKKMKEMA
ncbi:MAG: sigma 54-interacting transcriptional regulator [Smithellaceae bacterium]|nr:sigma 54-interacting transcriptional regulator [Smithellaceae bacterium]